ncbi:MAG: hypothetical protein A2Z74_04325 [Chloroflexi bacterium RBG_13_46_9]|nr:MAG: hypothetical protein A2Z74_04325 [Chloroflexi bacterium RBG_13_46_9]
MKSKMTLKTTSKAEKTANLNASSTLKKVQGMDKKKLAREIHDDIGQPLTAAKLIIERLRISPQNSQSLIEEVRSLISEAQVKAVRLCLELQEEQ